MLIERPELIRTAILVGTGPWGSTGVFSPDVEKAAAKIPADAQSLLSLFFEPSRVESERGTSPPRTADAPYRPRAAHR